MAKVFPAIILLLTLFLSMVALIYAEDVFGIPVYPGAKLDQETTKFLKDSMKVDAAAYRTSDSVVKVAAFYKGQKMLTAVSEDKEGAMFMKGSYEITVTVQNPWKDMRTGKLMTDTLISIVKGQ